MGRLHLLCLPPRPTTPPLAGPAEAKVRAGPLNDTGRPQWVSVLPLASKSISGPTSPSPTSAEWEG